MPSGTRINQILGAEMLDAITAQLDSGSLGAIIEIRTGSPPATVEELSTGTLLAVCRCSVTSFPPATPGTAPADATMFANPITADANANNGGTAGYFVAGPCSSGEVMGTKVILGTAGEAADTPDLVLDESLIVVNGTVAVTGWTITMPTS